MIAPTRHLFWQAFAQRRPRCFGTIDLGRGAVTYLFAGQAQHGPRHTSCPFSLSLRSGPTQAGPTFSFARFAGNCGKSAIRCCNSWRNAVCSVPLRIVRQSRSSCAERLSPSRSLPSRCRAACPARPHEVLPGQRLAVFWPMRPVAMRSAGLWSAAPLASQVAGLNSACRLARKTTDLTAVWQHPSLRTTRADRAGGPLRSAC